MTQKIEWRKFYHRAHALASFARDRCSQLWSAKLRKVGHQKYCNHSTFWTLWFNQRLIRSNDADGMTNSVDPDQTLIRFLHAFQNTFDYYRKDQHGREASSVMVGSFEPRHEKTGLCHMRTTKVPISLLIRVVWAAPLLCVAWIV